MLVVHTQKQAHPFYTDKEAHPTPSPCIFTSEAHLSPCISTKEAHRFPLVYLQKEAHPFMYSQVNNILHVASMGEVNLLEHNMQGQGRPFCEQSKAAFRLTPVALGVRCSSPTPAT